MLTSKMIITTNLVEQFVAKGIKVICLGNDVILDSAVSDFLIDGEFNFIIKQGQNGAETALDNASRILLPTQFTLISSQNMEFFQHDNTFVTTALSDQQSSEVVRVDNQVQMVATDSDSIPLPSIESLEVADMQRVIPLKPSCKEDEDWKSLFTQSKLSDSMNKELRDIASEDDFVILEVLVRMILIINGSINMLQKMEGRVMSLAGVDDKIDDLIIRGELRLLEAESGVYAFERISNTHLGYFCTLNSRVSMFANFDMSSLAQIFGKLILLDARVGYLKRCELRFFDHGICCLRKSY